ncbi:conserved hypothetical protein [Desulfatibacillum aliphaticivorans]|uniref:Orotate phosphoribosyltransferase n=1 Tax=Desulfatibacillum aliphaticivorans TaxID=218208 RepID=B8FMK3_DESAL|nr:DUF4870 domain-containing protein [Desulfatibacillum aliphaticivorans]ACL01870.1 conserved hypothetical protein [Desulfatibacillum aliphaticivorans]
MQIEHTPIENQAPDQNARRWAALCHIGGLLGLLALPSIGNILVPLVLWLIKKESHPFIDQEGKKALNFQICTTIYTWITGLLCFVLIGFVIAPVLAIFVLVVCIIATVKAADGVGYKYPLTIRFIK